MEERLVVALPSCVVAHQRAGCTMEAQEILANIAFTTSGALVDLVDSM